MGTLSTKLHSVQGGFSHWCPGCERMHIIYTDKPHGWDFNNNLDYPTFNPSVRVSYNGPDADTYRKDGRRAPSAVCHYFLHEGLLKYCSDSTHRLKGQTIPLAEPPQLFSV